MMKSSVMWSGMCIAHRICWQTCHSHSLLQMKAWSLLVLLVEGSHRRAGGWKSWSWLHSACFYTTEDPQPLVEILQVYSGARGTASTFRCLAFLCASSKQWLAIQYFKVCLSKSIPDFIFKNREKRIRIF